MQEEVWELMVVVVMADKGGQRWGISGVQTGPWPRKVIVFLLILINTVTSAAGHDHGTQLIVSGMGQDKF